jgi:predicted esterase
LGLRSAAGVGARVSDGAWATGLTPSEVVGDEAFLAVAQEGIDRSGWDGTVDVPVLNAIIADLWAAYDADDRRIYATGFSAGGAFAYMLGLYNSESFAAIGAQSAPWSYLFTDPDWPSSVARKLPVDIHHGRSDSMASFANAERARDALLASGHTVFFHPFDGGHTILAGHPDEMWANIGPVSLP